MIDFEIPDDVKALRREVAEFVDEVILPAEAQIGTRPFFDIVRELQGEARARGLYAPFIPKEWGGMGLGHLANAVVQIEVARSFTQLGAWALNCRGPQDATMLTLLEHGTQEQKEKYLRPLVNGDIRMCFSMTERAAGSDATGMRTTAVRDGDEWVLNGEKWFSSHASISQLALVMARTNPEAPRREQFSTFLVELPNPGYQIIRDIPVLGENHLPRFENELTGGHAEVRIDNLRIPAENILGGEGQGFNMGQFRLGYGRLRHGMLSIAKAQRALDLATARVIERSTFGSPLADRQGVQWMLADCAKQLYISRLLVLHVAYKMENGLDIRQENAVAKTYISAMLAHVIDTAIQLHGALGYTHDTPLAAWYAEARSQRLVDGPDEVHNWQAGRRVIEVFRRDGTTAAAAGGELFGVTNHETWRSAVPSNDEPIVLFEKRGNVGIITLNRPAALNSIHAEMAARIGEAVHRLHSDADLRVGVLAARGRAFCAGADLKALAAGEAIFNDDKPEWGFGGIVRHWTDKPMIAAVNGPAMGGGAEVALAADLIVLEASAKIGFPEVTVGVIAAAGGLLRIGRQLPWRLALEAALTGVPLDAETALAYGLVNRVVPDGEGLDAAIELATQIAANAPLAVQATKRLMYSTASLNEWGPEAWAVNDAELRAIYATQDAKEGPRAFTEKRKPVWIAS